jgi:hypothetical protein
MIDRALGSPDPLEVIERARMVLDQAWNPDMCCCFPNRYAYPHQWLWDSSFHIVAWATLGDRRGIDELESLFSGQLDNGFMPHIRYSAPTSRRGPLLDRSSFTQPPIYAHALKKVISLGLGSGSHLVEEVGRALEYLYEHRRAENGLVYLVHPWEAGTDDSPRWDSWVGIEEWDIGRLSSYDSELVNLTYFDSYGGATWSKEFVVCPASFNALTAWAFSEYADVTGSAVWKVRSVELSNQIDEILWNESEHLWDDFAIVGGGSSVNIPTVDGVLPALVTSNPRFASSALEQLVHPDGFSARYGLTFLRQTDDRFLPDIYWRGPAWPHLEYLLWLAALRWSRADIASSIAAAAIKGVLKAEFAEYWNPLTGQGHGGKPQTWSAVMAAVAMYYND